MTFESDEWGYPVLGDWYYAAYVKSEQGIKWATEIELWREKIKRQAEGYVATTIDSNLIQIGEIFFDDEIDATFELDWQQMKWGWLNFPLSEQQVTALKRSLRNRYSIVCNLFAHYCGYGQGNGN
jgi:hypothetical protein